MQTTWSNSGIGGVVPTQRDSTPSAEDVAITKDLIAAGNLLGIELLDHVVLGNGQRYVSLNERRLAFK